MHQNSRTHFLQWHKYVKIILQKNGINCAKLQRCLFTGCQVFRCLFTECAILQSVPFYRYNLLIHLVLCRTSNRSEKCAFVLARSSKLSFFVCSCSLEVRIRVRYSEILAEHINVFRILLHKSTMYLMFVLLDVRISNARCCSCLKILENRRSYSLDTQKICVRHNTIMLY